MISSECAELPFLIGGCVDTWRLRNLPKIQAIKQEAARPLWVELVDMRL